MTPMCVADGSALDVRCKAERFCRRLGLVT